ncbi:LCP family protein [Spirochaeta isovalerica]|uniref:Anionic cell wall polymer biosynthesis LytR-Cps2A-Psr (LCP) family protein n=1 Tax=Spirochaeta isovalerica TaxID=150 RepID=A0A841R8G9_9SPIO|nr:LCP family protein [Spirochaeta isovalerica]MBB6479028.1 anionic cell wall polymer biosynthesis LytR-Cps2A-Psr (LCP) family protein [Spirochaeta isovalerica]
MVKSEAIVPVMIIVSEEDKPLLTELFLFYHDTGKGAVLDIPGNTGSIISNLKKVDRIDILYDEDNIDPYRAKVGDLTGIDIPFYYIISLENLEKMVDLIDGLNLFIANPVDIRKDGRTYLLPSGSVTLDGAKVVSYLLYNIDGESDSEKIDRNHKFIKSLLEKMADSRGYLSTDEVSDFTRDMAVTNMDRKSFENFLSYLSDLDMDRLQYNKVLGVKRFVDNKELLFPHYDERLLKELVNQIEDYLVNIQSLSDQGVAFSVEILNGTDINGLASRTSQILKSFGYKIAGLGNATRTDGQEVEKTVILDRKGNPDAAKGLAALLKCERWHSEADESLDDTIDITLILGKDFDGRYVK